MFYTSSVSSKTDLTNRNVFVIIFQLSMFQDATVFNGDISTWDVKNGGSFVSNTILCCVFHAFT